MTNHYMHIAHSFAIHKPKVRRLYHMKFLLEFQTFAGRREDEAELGGLTNQDEAVHHGLTSHSFTVSPPSSSRRKRKSGAVMRRGIPSSSPRAIQQLSMGGQQETSGAGDSEGSHSMEGNQAQQRFYCSVCRKSFSRQFSWKVHMNVHRGIFPYTCSVCGKGFTSHINLKGHTVQHTNQREFKCQACGKEFIYKRGLNAHISICKASTMHMYSQTAA